MAKGSIHPPDGRFSCQSCGRCCTVWSVTVDQAKVEALRKEDWSAIGPQDPFEKNRGPGEAFRLKMVEGRCFFLDTENRCQIHAKLGYDAKPEGCKAFPLHFVELSGQSYARLSFYCPSVTKNEGKKLRDQQRWLRATQKAAGDVSRGEKLTLDGEHPISDKQAHAIQQRLERLLGDESQSMARRIAACAGLVALLIELADERGGEKGISEALQRLNGLDLGALAKKGAGGGRASMAGPVLSLFLGADCGPGKLARMSHFFNVRLFNLGVAALRSHTMQGKASIGAIRAVRFDPPDDAATLLTRYFKQKLAGRRHLAGSLSLQTGINLLVTAYAVINLLARLGASAKGRDRCDAHDVAAAVQAVDLLVVEHSTLRHGPMFGHLVDAILNQPALCGALLARLGLDVAEEAT